MDYTVKTATAEEDRRLEGNAAIVAHEPCEMVVNSDSNPYGYMEIILHESIHAIEVACGIRLKERQVCVLARGLVAVIRDNKGLLALLEGECE